jgi:two-component system, response regulator PdtaR
MSGKLRVLVADDERDTREYLQELLTRLGHEVAVTDNGRHLVEMAHASPPDLVITDVRMPDMDGLEAAREINRERPTPVIVVSGYHDAGLLARAAEQPVMSYLIKPVSESHVEAAITVAMARAEEHRRARQEAHELKQTLEERKVIERAKGAVMRRLGVSEEQAFRLMRKLSSEQNRRMVEVSRTVLQAEEVFHLLERV